MTVTKIIEQPNVEFVRKSFNLFEILIQNINVKTRESLTLVKNRTGGFFELAVNINSKPLEQGIEFTCTLQRCGQSEDTLTPEIIKIAEASYPEHNIKTLDAEFILGEAIGYGVVKFESGTIFEGLINKKTKLPYLYGIFSGLDNDGNYLRQVKVMQGIEFDIFDWSVTNKTEYELSDFLLKQSKKGFLSDTVEKYLAQSCALFDKDPEFFKKEALDYTVSFLEGIVVRSTGDESVFKMFSVVLDKFHESDLSFLVVEKETGYVIKTALNWLLEMLIDVSPYYEKTGELLYDLPTIADLLKGKVCIDAERTLLEAVGYKDKNVKLYIKLPTSTLGTLTSFNEAKLYASIVDNDQKKIIELENLRVQYKYLSVTHRAEEFFSNREELKSIAGKVDRWVGSTLYIVVSGMKGEPENLIRFDEINITPALYNKLF